MSPEEFSVIESNLRAEDYCGPVLLRRDALALVAEVRRLFALLERAWPMVDDITNHWEGNEIATPEGAAKKLSTDILEAFPDIEWP